MIIFGTRTKVLSGYNVDVAPSAGHTDPSIEVTSVQLMT